MFSNHNIIGILAERASNVKKSREGQYFIAFTIIDDQAATPEAVRVFAFEPLELPALSTYPIGVIISMHGARVSNSSSTKQWSLLVPKNQLSIWSPYENESKPLWTNTTFDLSSCIPRVNELRQWWRQTGCHTNLSDRSSAIRGVAGVAAGPKKSQNELLQHFTPQFADSYASNFSPNTSAPNIGFDRYPPSRSVNRANSMFGTTSGAIDTVTFGNRNNEENNNKPPFYNLADVLDLEKELPNVFSIIVKIMLVQPLPSTGKQRIRVLLWDSTGPANHQIDNRSIRRENQHINNDYGQYDDLFLNSRDQLLPENGSVVSMILWDIVARNFSQSNHVGRWACLYPVYRHTRMGLELGAKGLLNCQVLENDDPAVIAKTNHMNHEDRLHWNSTENQGIEFNSTPQFAMSSGHTSLIGENSHRPITLISDILRSDQRFGKYRVQAKVLAFHGNYETNRLVSGFCKPCSHMYDETFEERCPTCKSPNVSHEYNYQLILTDSSGSHIAVTVFGQEGANFYYGKSVHHLRRENLEIWDDLEALIDDNASDFCVYKVDQQFGLFGTRLNRP